MNIKSFQKQLKSLGNEELAKANERFHKTAKGEYAYGDKFLGIRVPTLRALAKQVYREIDNEQVLKHLQSKWHEERLIALFIMTHHYQKADQVLKKKIMKSYLNNTDYINNWDLVDASAHKILGHYCFHYGDEKVLKKLARSGHLWQERIAMVACWYYNQQSKIETTFEISNLLLDHEHDLIHKAVGWMIREAYKKDSKKTLSYIKSNLGKFAPTSLRYALEKLPKEQRAVFYQKNKSLKE